MGDKDMEMRGRNVLLGVTSSVAIYKACELASRLKNEGADVHVVMTEHATQLISPQLFGEITQNPVSVKMFSDNIAYNVQHISLAEAADLAVLAPATANTLGKLACGIADNMLSTTLLAIPADKKPVVIAPAMNPNMYNHSSVQKNITALRQEGYRFVGPEVGRLACGGTGLGKLASPKMIMEYLKQMELP
jgi:phosphopantothenoylcysteine decarboxylase/phosphopantothenate--cysteine ligase